MRFAKELAICTVLAIAAPVGAQEAAPAPAAAVDLRPGMVIVSSDGRRIGRIERVLGESGAPTGVTVIKDSKFVTVPAGTLSSGEHGRVVTSLAYRDVR